MKKFLFFCLCLFAAGMTQAQYTTPGTGVNWSMDDLVTNSAGAVTLTGTHYNITADLIIAATDTLQITTNDSILINELILIESSGAFIVDAPEQVVFTATDTLAASKWRGIKFNDDTYTKLHNATFSYGGGLKVNGGVFEIDHCTLKKNHAKTGSTGAISSTGSVSFTDVNPVITHCDFLYNESPAISSGANMDCAATIKYNLIKGNTTKNNNRPQINMGPTGDEGTTIITGNTVIGEGKTLVGGIAITSLMSIPTHCIVDSNIVKNNRYGIAFIGNKITTSISYNTIEDNNIQNNPMQGGSGLNFASSGTDTWIHATATGNTISGNLWGITIIGNPTLNMGDTAAANYNPGLNVFSNNGNNGTSCDLYNNGTKTQYAMGNTWNTDVQDSIHIEAVVMHVADNADLGRVFFTPAAAQVPVTFTVKDADNAPVADATITIEGEENTLTTNAAGVAEVTLSNNLYNYQIVKENYTTASGSFTAISEDVNLDITLTTAAPVTYTVTFTVKDADGVLEGASIAINNTTLTTDAQGEATIELEDGDYNYTITKTDYVEATGNVTVAGADLSETVTLTAIAPATYTVTFKVSDNAGAALQGATVAINNETITTDANGEAAIDLEDGDYDYTITATSFDTQTGSVTVAGANENVEIGMTVGIGEVEAAALRIYPNPTTGMIYTTGTTPFTATVYSQNGMMMIKQDVAVRELNITNLPSGNYIIQMNFDGTVISRTINKQ